MKRIALFVCLMLSACATPLAPQCPAGADAREIAQVYFGRNIGGALGVSDADWTAFVDREITPRFPEGLTVSDALGQWRDTETGAVVREPSKVLTLFLDEASDRARIDDIAAAYKSQFQQQAVAVITSSACVAF